MKILANHYVIEYDARLMSELANTKVELLVLPSVGFLLYSYRMHNTQDFRIVPYVSQ